jgi:aspartyl protease family protein
LGLFLWLGLLAATGGGMLLAAKFLPFDRETTDWTEALRLFGILALVSSGLVSARRFDLGATARVVVGWVAIFAVIVTGYALRDDVLRLALRARSALIPAYAVQDTAHSLVITRGEGDAFYVIGQVNGAPVRFLIDTGSTDIVLSPADAERGGLTMTGRSFDRPTETANGVGYGAAAVADSLVIGPIRLTHVPVSINQAPMTSSLLGMPFLQRLESFEVRGDRLFLRGRS